MLLRAYSILGTLVLALCVASPALAAGKGKRKTQDSAEQDDVPQRSAKKKKKKKKQEEPAEEKAADSSEASESAGSDSGGDIGTSNDQMMPDDKVWEKPPADEEKPKPKVEAPVEEKKAGDNRPWSAGLAVGWGMKTDRRTADLGADPYGLAAGLRGGYEFDFQLWVGLYFNWYLGNSVTGTDQRLASGEKTTHANYWQFGAEVGYDVWIASVIMRPSLQIGEAIAVTDKSGPTETVSDIMFGPGLTVLYPWDNMYIGGEMRGNLLSGDGASALLLAAQLGMRFEE